MSEVYFGLSSNRNVTFHYIEPSGYSKEEWDEMTDEEKEDTLLEYMHENVSVWVEEE